MNVLLLTDRPQYLAHAILEVGDDYTVAMGSPETWPDTDYIVSFGYRHLIREPYLSQYKNRMINIHISLLPWNRGADPNFWSWFDNTPKGVSAHLIDSGIDTGYCIGQMEVTKWRDEETLKTSYDFLIECAANLFHLEWINWRDGVWNGPLVTGEGTYHKAEDKEKWMSILPNGWDTSVSEVQKLGNAYRSSSLQ